MCCENIEVLARTKYEFWKVFARTSNGEVKWVGTMTTTKSYGGVLPPKGRIIMTLYFIDPREI